MSKYLDQLKYEEKSFSARLRAYVASPRMAVLVLLFLIGIGTTSFFAVPRTVNPPIDITIVTVSTGLLGASSTDVEALVAVPLEQEIESIDGIDTLYNASGAGWNFLSVQFVDSVVGSRALTDVQNAVGRVLDLPEDATTPLVKLMNFDDEPILRFAVVAGEGVDSASIAQFGTRLRDALEDGAQIDRVAVSGLAEEQVQIIADADVLATRGITQQFLAQAIANATSSYPAGTIKQGQMEFAVTIDTSVSTLEDLRKVVIVTPIGRWTLGDLAMVVLAPEPDIAPAMVAFGGKDDARTAVIMTVWRNLSSEVTHASAAAIEIVNTQIDATDGAFELVILEDINAEMSEQFSDLGRNLAITVALVFVALLIFVGLRQALIAALSIPLVYLSAFAVMAATGITVNFISLFSLLLALGIIVDVTIVVISAMTLYYRTGKFTPAQTGLLVWRDFFGMLSITTLTTIWAFVPLLLSSGIIGEFIKPIPIIVSTMLGASVVIGFVIMVPLMVWLLGIRQAKTGKRSVNAEIAQIGRWTKIKFKLHKLANKITSTIPKRILLALDVGVVKFARLEQYYRKTLTKIITSTRNRRLTIVAVVALAAVSFSLLPLGLVKNEFFPKENMDRVYIGAQWAVGTTSGAVVDGVAPLLSEFAQIEAVDSVSVQIGAKLDERSMPTSAAGNNALFTLMLVPEQKRPKSQVIAADLRKQVFLNTDAKITIAEPTSGPPAGADITLKFKGDNFEVMNNLTREAMDYLATIEGVVNIADSSDEMPAKIVFVPNAEKIAQNGLSVPAVAAQLRTYISGVTLASDVTLEGVGQKDVVLRYNQNMPEADVLTSANILTPSGAILPIGALGDWIPKQQMSEIIRIDSKRTVSVTASVTEGTNAVEVNTKLLDYVNTKMTIPVGYEVATGGANEENNKSVQSIMMAMGLAFVLIFCTLVVQLQSYRKAVIVLMVIPLAIAGVFVVFAATGTPLSFPALIGILALFGIVINNSIIIVSQINANNAAGLTHDDAIIDGAASRLEPIILSSITTIIGLLPITLTDPMWRGLGGAIIAGLTFSGVIMLVFIPTVYASILRKK